MRLILLMLHFLMALYVGAVEVPEASLPSEPRQLPSSGVPARWEVSGAAFWQGPLPELELTPQGWAESRLTLRRPGEAVFEAKGAKGFQVLLSGEALGEIGAGARIEVLEGERLIASVEASARNPGGGLRYRCDSVQPGSGLSKIFDQDSQSVWHSHYQHENKTPHWCEIDLGGRREIRGLTITSRPDRSNGTPGRIKISGADSLGQWETLFDGKVDFRSGTRQEIPFTAAVPLRYLRLEFPGSENWFTAFAGLEPLGHPWPAAADGSGAPFFLALSATETAKILGREITLRIRHGRGGAITLRRLHTYILPSTVNRSMQAKENGVDGPDLQDFGLLGFQALALQDHPVLVAGLVRPGLAAARAGLREGDLIVGVDGKALPPIELGSSERGLSDSPLACLGMACERSLRQGRREIGLEIFRDGQARRLGVRLDSSLGTGFAAGFPAPADALLDRLESDCKSWLLKRQKPDGSWSEQGTAGIQTPLAGLALLGSRDPACLPAVARAVDWCLKSSRGRGYFEQGLALMLVAEYHLASGDKKVLGWLESTLESQAGGTNNTIWGHDGWGHGAGAGLPYGNKGLIGAAIHVVAGEALAGKCGVPGRFLEAGKSYFLNSWGDPAKGENGSMGYNASAKDGDEFWSRTGLSLMALTLRDEHPEMRGPMLAIMKKRFFMFRQSHAYGEPGGSLGLAGLACADAAAYREVMGRLAFHWLIAWEPGYGLRYTSPSMGAPYMGQDGLLNPAMLFALSGRRQGLACTGARDRGWAAVARIATSRGSLVRDAAGRWDWGAGLGATPQDIRLGAEPVSLPLKLEAGGVVRWSLGQSPILQILPPAAPMTPHASSFHKDEKLALRRLAAAIDGDPHSLCFSDGGYEAPYFPHFCEFRNDVGAVLDGLELEFSERQGRPDEVAVLVPAEGGEWKDLLRRRLGPQETRIRLGFEPRLVKILRIVFHRDDEKSFAEELRRHPLERRPGEITERQSSAYDAVAERGVALQIRHLELLQPVPQVVIRPEGFVVTAPAGFEARYTVDGSTPLRSSPLAPPLLAAATAPALCTRLFAADWDGPVRVDLPQHSALSAPPTAAAVPVPAQALRSFFPPPVPPVPPVPPDPLQDGLAWVLLALSAIAIVLFVLLARLRRRGGKAN
jgi:hypothetical protein